MDGLNLLVPHRRLRMHHVHWEFWSASGSDSRCHSLKRSCGVLCSFWKSELRRSHRQIFGQLARLTATSVAYAVAGTVDIDLESEPIGVDSDGTPVMLSEVWPTPEEVDAAVRAHVQRDQFETEYATVFEGSEAWRGSTLRGRSVPMGRVLDVHSKSTVLRRSCR